MKNLLVLALVLVIASPVAFAGPQQEKMKTCNAQAKGKKGDERKAFMKSCLSAKGDTSASSESVDATKSPADAAIPATKNADPKQRMKDCNAQATGKKGDERKSFMSSCLKN